MSSETPVICVAIDLERRFTSDDVRSKYEKYYPRMTCIPWIGKGNEMVFA